MSGSSKSFNNINLYACRVGSAPEYTPPYLQNGTGKQIRQMCTISVCQNLGDKESWFRITGWGKMADIMARSCAPGKELDIVGRVHSYKGRIAMPRVQGQQVQFYAGADGQPLTTDKIGIVIEHIKFGADSDKQLAFEIQQGMRPALWNVTGHPDNVQWKTICQQRNSTQYVQGNTHFGYAVVRQPNGQIIDPATLANNNGNAATTGTAVAAATNAPAGFGGVAAQTGAPAGQAGAPVEVHGQNMGYAMPAGQAAPAQNAPAGTAPAQGGFSM